MKTYAERLGCTPLTIDFGPGWARFRRLAPQLVAPLEESAAIGDKLARSAV